MLRAFGLEPVYMAHACDGAEAIWKHPEQHGYELLQGAPQFEGELFGG